MTPNPKPDGLLLPTAKHIFGVMIGEEYVNKLKGMYISLDSVHRRRADIKRLNSYSVIYEPFLRPLRPFPLIYLCKTVFSGLLFIKSKYSIRLDAEDEDNCDIAQIIPRIPYLEKQQQD
ncbi:hypothetical protein RF11_14743 [Thelohanellus kitauei]|uniref:Uncharacterized protein n=1 Tax=Thelohanellus kitauei TaxID=669202 RepID=A0A0C2MGC6_THEKT|nr:hypothetical protein RF11_14743 [Thelohanellus kitauei]